MSDRFVHIPWESSQQKGEVSTLELGPHLVIGKPVGHEVLVSLDDGPSVAYADWPQWIDTEEGVLVPKNRTFTTDSVDVSKKKLKKLNRIAAKIGLAPLKLHTLRKFNRSFKNKETGLLFLVPYREMYVEGDAPRIEGHTFLAKIEHGAHGNFIDVAPGVELDLKAKRDVDNYCEHCGTRRERKDTFLLATPDKEIIQVGRNCLADFLRGTNPTNLVAFWRVLNEFGEEEEKEEFGGVGGGVHGYLPEDVLAYTHRAIQKEGWVSKTRAAELDKPATASTVEMFSMRSPRASFTPSERVAWEKLQPHQEDRDVAELAIEWLMEQDPDSEYIYKLQLIAKEGYVEPQRIGLWASLMASYLRAMDRLEIQRRERESMLNEHFGEVGKRYDLELEVLRTNMFEGSYGYTTIIAFRDKDGRQFTWFASGDKMDEFEKGDFVAGKATIKKHDDYKDIAQTHITRAKFKNLSEQ